MAAQILGPDGAPARLAMSATALSGPYRAGSTASQELYAWRPPLLSADREVLPQRDLSLARARDLVRNDPHAAAGIARLNDMLVGAGIRLAAKPDHRALGISPEAARALRTQIEAEWRLIVNDPLRFADATRRLSLNGLWRLFGQTWSTAGEVTAVLKWRADGRARYHTCVLAVDPDRLSNPSGEPDSARLRGGVEFDPMGAPLAYHVRNAHPADYDAGAAGFTWARIPRETVWGRPVFVHGFEPTREGQSRAITPFAALVQRLRMIGTHADLEIANATANALFTAFVKSSLPVADAAASFDPQEMATLGDKRLEYWESAPPTLGGVRIPVLPIGDEIAMNASPRQTTAFPAFQTAFLRSISSALGLSYEQLSMDWSQVNYSSARAALNEVWRGVRRNFAAFVEQVVMPIYLAFLEEAVERGYVVLPKGAPEFWDMPAAYVASRWIGAPRGYVDPVKEAQAANMRIDGRFSTLEAENAEQGLDWEETLDQAEYEEAELKRRGLVRVTRDLKPEPADAAAADERPGERPKSLPPVLAPAA